MTRHPGSAAYYENGKKGNKEGIAFITLARGHVASENLAKEMKKIMRQEETCVLKIWGPFKNVRDSRTRPSQTFLESVQYSQTRPSKVF